MKVLINNSLCQGHAQCNAQSPRLFPLDDDGYIGVEQEVDVPAGLEDEARRGVGACPERVLSIRE
jgi:ferredoxin